MNPLRAMLAVVMLCAGAVSASAHALDPGFLDLRMLGADRWKVTWTVPQSDGEALPLTAVLPATCAPARAPFLRPEGSAFKSSWIADCPGGLEGGTIRIEGLETTRTDVLVRYELSAGVTENHRLTPTNLSFVVPLPQGLAGIAAAYGALGIDHILTGFDHLLFVFALMLLVPGGRRLVGAISAFTVGHSLSLAAVTLGWLVVPAPPVEAVVALSIMVLSVELLRRPEAPESLSERHPWLVSALFGLLHGLGFANALREIGLPRNDVPWALLSFNLGVEAGQLLFVAVVVLCGLILARFLPRAVASVVQSGGRGRGVLAYAIGIVSASWLISRLAAF